MPAVQISPTKGNLLKAKRSLEQAKLGYELMDRKRNILIRELMTLVNSAKSIRGKIEQTYNDAYHALQNANIALGIVDIYNVANTIPIEKGISVTYRSVMGVEIPSVTMQSTGKISPAYGFGNSNSQLDIAYISFNKAKDLTVILAEIENSIYRLAIGIKKSQKRANALKNIMIPQFENMAKSISESLEEKDREEFSRQKVIKASKERLNKSKDI